MRKANRHHKPRPKGKNRMKNFIMAALAVTLFSACNSTPSTPEALCKKANSLNSDLSTEICTKKLSALKEADKAMFDKVAECIAKAGDLIELGVCNKKKK